MRVHGKNKLLKTIYHFISTIYYMRVTQATFFFIHSIFTWSFILCFYRSFYFLHKIVDNFMRWLLNEMAHQFMSIERVQMMTLFPKAEIIPWSSMLIWGEIKHRNEQSDKRKCNHRNRIRGEKTSSDKQYMREKFNCLIWLAVYACCYINSWSHCSIFLFLANTHKTHTAL